MATAERILLTLKFPTVIKREKKEISKALELIH